MACTACNGSGTVVVEKTCVGCNGVGNVICGMCNGARVGMDGEPCRGPCGGQGYFHHWACDGKGTIPTEVPCPECRNRRDG